MTANTFEGELLINTSPRCRFRMKASERERMGRNPLAEALTTTLGE
jgi:hypothetical protein